MKVISADCHINEPPHVFERVPDEYKDRIPRMMPAPDGGDGWSFDGGPPKRSFGIEAMAGVAKEDYRLSGMKFEEIMPGNYDGTAHCADMDIDGVWGSVVYPANSIFTYLEPDRGLAVACMRSYNDWVLDEFQGAAPDRLRGLPMLPTEDGMDITLAEVDRVVEKGAKGLFIPGMPSRPYNDPYYEPLWKACSELDVPVTFHRTFGGKPPDSDWDELVEQNVSVPGIVNRFFSAVRPLTYMIFAGIFDRHPNLKVVAAEVNYGWVPFWYQTMDDEYHTQAAWSDSPMERTPSSYLGTNVFVTGLDDHNGHMQMANGNQTLVNMSMWSSDYPHSVTLWPDSRQIIAELVHDMTEPDTQKVLYANAARVYKYN